MFNFVNGGSFSLNELIFIYIARVGVLFGKNV